MVGDAAQVSEEPICVGSPDDESCSTQPTRFIYNPAGQPTYFCEKHYGVAVEWLVHGCHEYTEDLEITQEAEELAANILRVNAEKGNPLRPN
jgi:hypothetical protein